MRDVWRKYELCRATPATTQYSVARKQDEPVLITVLLLPDHGSTLGFSDVLA